MGKGKDKEKKKKKEINIEREGCGTLFYHIKKWKFLDRPTKIMKLEILKGMKGAHVNKRRLIIFFLINFRTCMFD